MANKKLSKSNGSSLTSKNEMPQTGNDIIHQCRIMSPMQVMLANAKTDRKLIVHKPGKVAVVIDGVEYEPKDLSRFNGSPLHFLIHNGYEKSNSIVAYKTINELQSAMVSSSFLGGAFHAGHIPKFADVFLQCACFDDLNFKGNDWLTGPFPGTGFDDLSTFGRGIMAGVTMSWNDCISSIAGNNLADYHQFFEHAHYQGSSFTLFPNTSLPDLTKHSWNDRISSIFNYGLSNPMFMATYANTDIIRRVL